MSYSDLLQERAAASRQPDRQHELQSERIKAERASLARAETRIQQRRDARIDKLHAIKEAQRIEESKAQRAAEMRSTERSIQQKQSQEIEDSMRPASARFALQTEAATGNPKQEGPEHSRQFPSPLPKSQIDQEVDEPRAVRGEQVTAEPQSSPAARQRVEKRQEIQNDKLAAREEKPSRKRPESSRTKEATLPDESPARKDTHERPVQTKETTPRMGRINVEEPKKRVVRREEEPPQLPNANARSQREESLPTTKLRRQPEEEPERTTTRFEEEQPASAPRPRSLQLVEAGEEGLLEPPGKPPAHKTLSESEAIVSTPQETASDDGPGELSQLKTSGHFIVDAFCNSVMLRGVTVAGLDTLAPTGDQSFRDALALDDANLSLLTGLWGANLVRLPFQASTFLTGNGALSADALLSGLDEIIAAINDAGAWVLLTLDTISGSNAVQTQDIFRVWQLLAERYWENHGVLYELVAPPSVSGGDWQQLAAALVGGIRSKNPASMIFLASGNSGVNINGLPLCFSSGTPVFNLVYVIDVSSGGYSEADCRQLEAFANSFPVFASNWREDEADFGRLTGFVAGLLDRYGIGWAASSWNASPRLVADAEHHDFTPSGWGLTVQRAMKLPLAPLLKSFRPFVGNATESTS
jgi:hypothetical protein